MKTSHDFHLRMDIVVGLRCLAPTYGSMQAGRSGQDMGLMKNGFGPR